MKVALEDLGRAEEKELERQARAYKRAVVRSLNRAPGLMQDKLVAEFKSTFRAPVPFTTNRSGYKMTLARMSMDVPEAKFGAKQKQSDFLIFPISGGERRPGDAGSSDKWIFQPTRFGKNTASGALQRYYTRELVKESGKSVIVRGGGGVFFGALGGDADDVGFVRRPQRTRARFKMNDKYKQVLARPSDDRIKVKDIGSPHMLAKATKKSEHKSIIDYDATANAAFSQAIEDI